MYCYNIREILPLFYVNLEKIKDNHIKIAK